MALGPNHVIFTDKGPSEADSKYLEPQGAAIEAGERDLQHLEERMEIMGTQPLIARTQMSTATGKVIDTDEVHSDAAAWIQALEMRALEVINIAYEWVKETPPEGLSVNIASLEVVKPNDSSRAKILDEARKRGDLSQRTYINELKRYDIISEDIDVDSELDQTSKEVGMSASMIGM